MSFNSLKDRFNGVAKPAPKTTQAREWDITRDEFVAELNGPGYYNTPESNWYTAKPYGFRMTLRDGSQWTFFLPIAPSNLTISTHFATNVIPTLYGTVEEHSDVRYYDIMIEGTTGIAPNYSLPSRGADDNVAAKAVKEFGRESFPVSLGVSAGGFFPKTIGAFNAIKNKASDILNGSQKTNTTGVYTASSGYAAFHNLYKFLLKYKKDASGADGQIGPRTGHPLTFFNYKDNNEYDVAVRAFTLKRSAENPMLYNYSIQLRAYNLRSPGSIFEEDNLKQRLADLGLAGIDSSSMLGDIKKMSGNAKQLVGALVGGLNVAGR